MTLVINGSKTHDGNQTLVRMIAGKTHAKEEIGTGTMHKIAAIILPGPGMEHPVSKTCNMMMPVVQLGQPKPVPMRKTRQTIGKTHTTTILLLITTKMIIRPLRQPAALFLARGVNDKEGFMMWCIRMYLWKIATAHLNGTSVNECDHAFFGRHRKAIDVW